MTQSARFAAIRTGRYADLAATLAWLVGAGATVAHPAGLAVAGLLLGVVASSPSRALASAASFGIVVAAAITTWVTVLGTWPVSVGLWSATGLGTVTSIVADPLLAVVLALLVPPIVAAPIRALG